ncbi:hypothetical protein BH09BAC2_BH09BAC2_15440 [soil metagenome]
MIRNASIKLKAAFLVIVFAMNTVVGFACAIGIDMGFNTKHHHEDDATEAVVYVHKDGKKHVHHESKEKLHHNKPHHQEEANKTGNGKDDCCNNYVKNFEQLDKSIPGTVSILYPVFITTFGASNYNFNVFPYTNFVSNKKPFVRGHHPPIPDICIAIQSFRI